MNQKKVLEEEKEAKRREKEAREEKKKEKKRMRVHKKQLAKARKRAEKEKQRLVRRVERLKRRKKKELKKRQKLMTEQRALFKSRYSKRERKVVVKDDLGLSSQDYNAKYRTELKSKLSLPMLSRFELLSKSFAEALVSSSLATLNLASVERPTFGHENLKKIAAAEQMKLKQEVSKETGSTGSAGPRKRSQHGVNSKRSTMKSDKKRRRRSTKNNAASNTTTNAKNAKRNVSTSTTRKKRVKAEPTRRRGKKNNVLGQYPCSHGCGKICLSRAGLVMHERACSGADQSKPRSRIRKRGTTKNKEQQEKVKRRKME
jgi:hypothetical protein